MFARIAGVSPSTVYALECGTRADTRQPTITAVSGMLGMSIDQFWRVGEWEAAS